MVFQPMQFYRIPLRAVQADVGDSVCHHPGGTLFPSEVSRVAGSGGRCHVGRTLLAWHPQRLRQGYVRTDSSGLSGAQRAVGRNREARPGLRGAHTVLVELRDHALAQQRLLADRMFDFYQTGEDALILPRTRDLTSMLPSAEVFWRLGMVNSAQRYMFDTQESILNARKSGRCTKRIAECMMVNGHYQTARKQTALLRRVSSIATGLTRPRR